MSSFAQEGGHMLDVKLFEVEGRSGKIGYIRWDTWEAAERCYYMAHCTSSPNYEYLLFAVIHGVRSEVDKWNGRMVNFGFDNAQSSLYVHKLLLPEGFVLLPDKTHSYYPCFFPESFVRGMTDEPMYGPAVEKRLRDREVEGLPMLPLPVPVGDRLIPITPNVQFFILPQELLTQRPKLEGGGGKKKKRRKVYAPKMVGHERPDGNCYLGEDHDMKSFDQQTLLSYIIELDDLTEKMVDQMWEQGVGPFDCEMDYNETGLQAREEDYYAMVADDRQSAKGTWKAKFFQMVMDKLPSLQDCVVDNLWHVNLSEEDYKKMIDHRPTAQWVVNSLVYMIKESPIYGTVRMIDHKQCIQCSRVCYFREFPKNATNTVCRSCITGVPSIMDNLYGLD